MAKKKHKREGVSPATWYADQYRAKKALEREAAVSAGEEYW